MSKELIRASLEACLPPGIFWTPLNELSDLFDAVAEALYPYYDEAIATACIRYPNESNLIDDLADEYGAEIFSTLTDEQIRLLAILAKTGVKEPGAGDLQTALQNAGFPVQVHRNGPVATNPANFIGDAIPFMVAGNNTAVAGNKYAQAGFFVGVNVIVNGLIQATVPITQSVAGNPNMVAGNKYAVAGYFESYKDVSFDTILPDDPDRWNQIYFIGGNAMRTPGGELYSIEKVQIPATRKMEFESIVLKYGLGDGWAGLFIDYV